MATLLLRNVPRELSDADVRRALMPYGSVMEVTMLPHMNQTIVRMGNPMEAQSIAHTRFVAIANATVSVEPYQPQQHQTHMGGGMQQQQQQQQQGMGGGGFVGGFGMGIGGYGAAPTALKVVVNNCRYPIDTKVLTEVFSMIAPPKLVHCGLTGEVTHAQVEFHDAASAKRAIEQMQGKSIYPDCCSMTLTLMDATPMAPAMQPQQPVLQSPFPQANLGGGGGMGAFGAPVGGMGGGLQSSQQAFPILGQQSHGMMMPFGQGGQQPSHFGGGQQQSHGGGFGVGGQGGFGGGNQGGMGGGGGNNMMGAYNNNNGGGGGYSGHQNQFGHSHHGHHSHHQHHHGGNAHGGGPYGGHHNQHGGGYGGGHQGHHGGGGHHGHHHSHHSHHNQHQHHSNSGNYGGGGPGSFAPRGGRGGPGFAGRGGGRGGGSFNPTAGFAPPPPPGQNYGAHPSDNFDTPFVMVFNVPETTSLHALWVLLEVYGNVTTVKRQYSSKKNVIVRFQYPEDARTAVGFLANCPFFGDVLSLKQFSGYQERGRTDWITGDPKDPATQAFDFSSQHHRSRPQTPNMTRKCRPREFLFVANLTDQITDDQVRELFRNKGFDLVDLERKSPTMVLVSLGTTEKAVQALCAIHALQIGERYLKVSFSSFAPWSPHPNALKDGGAGGQQEQGGDGAGLGGSGGGGEETAEQQAMAEESAAQIEEGQ